MCLSLDLCLLSILVKLIDLVNSVIISYDLTQIVNFPTQIPDCHSHSLAVLDLFFSSDASICFTMAFPLFGNPDHVVVLVSIDFLSYSQGMACFIALVVTILVLIGMVFMIIV